MPDNQSRVHWNYPLKPSRLALLFQWGSLVVLLLMLYPLHRLSVLLLLVLLSLIYFYYLALHPSPQVVLLTHLDQDEWSVKYELPAKIQRVQIIRVVDHKFYFVISIKQSTVKDLIIWYDQLSIKALKSLRIRAKLD